MAFLPCVSFPWWWSGSNWSSQYSSALRVNVSKHGSQNRKLPPWESTRCTKLGWRRLRTISLGLFHFSSPSSSLRLCSSSLSSLRAFTLCPLCKGAEENWHWCELCWTWTWRAEAELQCEWYIWVIQHDYTLGGQGSCKLGCRSLGLSSKQMCVHVWKGGEWR